MSPSGSKGKGKDKGKAPARSSNSGWDSRQQNTAALQRALRQKYGKKSRTEQAHQMSNDEGPFAGLEPINQSTDNQEITDDKLTTDQGTDYEQLNTSTTPGGSGSGHCVTESVAYAAPVARGQAAFNNPRPQPPRPRPRQPPLPQPAPPPLQEGCQRHLVPMPESKANISVEMILQDAGFSAVRWSEINNIIYDLMARVGMDYTSSWTRQNKQAMGALYAWVCISPDAINSTTGAKETRTPTKIRITVCTKVIYPCPRLKILTTERNQQPMRNKGGL
ncbi:unnamed protein product [Rhizoctonia solani]|uniref:Uncharacterized protein n=1 Tax=Rhizoctonia solani TaxID=456999 RepID=A0A8H2WEC9_9AGAM|nr:unnamed protein product [Rhizoctonia solani]